MNGARPLLIELGCEDLPVHAVDELAGAFAKAVCAGLSMRGIDADAGHARTFATPRRIAVLVPDVAGAQSEQHTERPGPYVNVALDPDGLPTRALLGFAEKAGVNWRQLDRAADARGERFVHRSVAPGRGTAELVPEIVRAALKELPVAKPMRWGDRDYAFARPVHWLVILHGGDVIDGECMGLRSGRQSRGHRFMHPAPVHLADPESYLDGLRAARVLADPAERRRRIREEVARAAESTGGTPELDDVLLDEIANLTEWPAAIACTFDRAFLAVPHEALTTTMRGNQKFVPVIDADGALTDRFIGVANLDSKDSAQIRHGYERVIRPRFADAKYFFDEDLKTPLASYQQGLGDVVWQRALGSLWDKTVRVAELASAIAGRLFAQGIEIDAAAAAHAAGLSRCDLLTRMVGEFPELQGVMGRHYAAAQGEPFEVASALDEFYRPRNADDGIAAGVLGQCVSLADKLDTLAGIFAVGLKPTGNKDPFALRRAALGLARTLIEGGLDLDLDVLLKNALAGIPDDVLSTAPPRGAGGEVADTASLRSELRDFIFDRLRGYYTDKGFTPRQFDAVVAVRPASLPDFDRRLRALADFERRPEAAILAAANKRVANILRREGIETAVAATRPVDDALLGESAERALSEALDAADSDNAARLGGDVAQRDYAGALVRLAALQAPVDAFFGQVLVMSDDPALRANRITLLARVKARFDAIAEIALL